MNIGDHYLKSISAVVLKQIFSLLRAVEIAGILMLQSVKEGFYERQAHSA
jgi:hypothetical protein